MKTCYSEVHHVFADSKFAFPCRIKTSTTYCSSHKSNSESTSQHHFISCLHGVCACLCWPGTSRGDQEAGARGTGKGHGNKVSISIGFFPRRRRVGISRYPRLGPTPSNPKIILIHSISFHLSITCILIKTFLLFCCFWCEAQEPPEEEALGRCGGQLVASMRGDRHVVETSWNTIQTGK